MKTKYVGKTLVVTAENGADALHLSVVAKVAEEISYIAELADARIRDAQHKMHEATTETAGIKKGLLFKISDFLFRVESKLRRLRQ